MSALEAALLQRRRGVFTGGFLSVDHLRTPGEIAAFLGLSLTLDAATAGLAAALVMALFARVGATAATTMTAGVMAGVGPLLMADAIDYEIARYLGPGFDLALMFDLTGRSVAEFWAVASSHLLVPLFMLTSCVSVAAGMLWYVQRRGGAPAGRPALQELMLPGALALAGSAVLVFAVSVNDAVGSGLLRKPSGRALAAVVTFVSDVDRDGFGVIGRMTDPDPFDAAVFPYAVDEPGNGIDEDGLAGDLPLDAHKYPEAPVTTARFRRTPDVLLVVLESFRADLIGAELDGRPITPVLNALARRGLAAPRAFSHNGYTVQSRFHLFAGTMTAGAGARTIIDDFNDNGYLTAYFSGQDESFGGPEYGVGFDRVHVSFDARAAVSRRYSTFATPGSLAVAHDVVQGEIDAFLAARAAEPRPVFLYASFEDTHFPYSHAGIESLVSQTRLARHEITPARREELWAMYVNTAANLDRAVGVLIERFRSARGQEPAIIVTADHGESLFDHGFLGHGYGLNDVQTQIPLIVVNLPLRVPDPFSQIDLRSALNDALAAPEEAAGPRLVPTGRPVLQYLGDLRRPRQIAYFKDGSRFIYDFRRDQVQRWDEPWRSRDALEAADPVFRQLVQHWELINLDLRRGRDDR